MTRLAGHLPRLNTLWLLVVVEAAVGGLAAVAVAAAAQAAYFKPLTLLLLPILH
jgi:hypothetical protein